MCLKNKISIKWEQYSKKNRTCIHPKFNYFFETKVCGKMNFSSQQSLPYQFQHFSNGEGSTSLLTQTL